MLECIYKLSCRVFFTNYITTAKEECAARALKLDQDDEGAAGEVEDGAPAEEDVPVTTKTGARKKGAAATKKGAKDASANTDGAKTSKKRPRTAKASLLPRMTRARMTLPQSPVPVRAAKCARSSSPTMTTTTSSMTPRSTVSSLKIPKTTLRAELTRADRHGQG